MCNKIWQTGEWLTSWTQFLVITLPKKGNLQQCQNYRTISLISHRSKVMLKIILNRLNPLAEKIITEEQQVLEHEGAPQSRSSTYAFYVRNISSTSKTSTMAFEGVWHAYLWATMKKYNISANLIRVIKHLYNKATSAVLFNNSKRDWFRTTVGVRQ